MDSGKKHHFSFGTDRFTLFIVLCICIINFVVYFPSINGYFLADDFMHISYLAGICHTQPLLLLTNFHTNWMQAIGTQFYRPLITLTLAFDYFIWGHNAIGFHLSNLFFQIACTLLLYFLIREMTAALEEVQSKSVSAIGAIFFAVYPLHPEAVSWVIGRVDSVATMFYLAAFLLFFKYRKAQAKLNLRLSIKCVILGASLVCYFCSLLSKEIAITLPLALWLWLFIFKESDKNFGRRFISVTKGTLPYWMLLILYLVIRTLALGTFYGGYSGSIGSGLSLSFVSRFLGDSSLFKLIFPFNNDLFSPRHPLRYLLLISYSLAGVLFGFRILNKRAYAIPSKLILFSLLWFVVCLLPTYQVFDLAADLQGSRLVYLASAPICLLLSLFLTPLAKASQLADETASKQWSVQAMYFFSIVLRTAILLVFTFATYINNLPWRYASDELKALQQSFIGEKEQVDSHEKFVLINTPQTYKGAHMLYNGTTLGLLCSLGHNISSSMISLEPVLYGDADLLNCARLKRLLSNKEHYVLFVWQRSLLAPRQNNKIQHFFDQFYINASAPGHLKRFKIQNYLASKTHASLNDLCDRSALNENDANKFKLITLPNLNIPTTQDGLLELSIKATPIIKEAKQASWLQLQWSAKDVNAIVDHGVLVQPLIIDSQTHKYLFNLGEHKAWLLCELIDQLKICGSLGDYKLDLENIRFINPENVIPNLGYDHIDGPREDDSGVCHSARSQGFRFWYDASKIKGAQAVVYEISKPNYWFEHEDETLTSNHLSTNAALCRKLPNLKGEFTVSGKDLKTGYFEVRIAAVDNKGNIVGLTSYPICGQVSTLSL